MGNAESVMSEALAVKECDRPQLVECLMEGCLDICEGCAGRFERVKKLNSHPENPEPMDIRVRYLTLRQLLFETPFHSLVMDAKVRVAARVHESIRPGMDALFAGIDAEFEAWKIRQAEAKVNAAYAVVRAREKEMFRQQCVDRKRRAQEEKRDAEKRSKLEKLKRGTQDITAFFGKKARESDAL
eukprot:jgi/Mesvir1/11576/Mv04338-RA.1